MSHKSPGKKTLWILFLSFFASILMFSISGCKTTEPQESNMPWAQPAEWEKENMLQKNILKINYENIISNTCNWRTISKTI